MEPFFPFQGRLGAGAGGWGSGSVEYSEDDPDAYLLCKDLENLMMRGVEHVELTVIRDDEVPSDTPKPKPEPLDSCSETETFGD